MKSCQVPMNKEELRYLISVLEREIGYCGLDTPAGKTAMLMKERFKLWLENLTES